MNFVNYIVVLAVQTVLFISSLLEEFDCNITELRIGKNILFLLIILGDLISELIKLRLKAIGRAAVDHFLVAADLLSELGVDLAGRFTVFTGNHILKFLRNHFIAFTEDDIEYGLSSHDL